MSSSRNFLFQVEATEDVPAGVAEPPKARGVQDQRATHRLRGSHVLSEEDKTNPEYVAKTKKG
jgi:hypothetical protein